MGLCRDFGSQITEGCHHLMRADSDSCHCDECGVVCKGRFEACPTVWAQGPQPVPIVAPPLLVAQPEAKPGTNGHGDHVPEAAAVTGIGSHAKTDAPVESPAVQPGTDRQPTASKDGAEVRRWFQSAFDGLRSEIEGLRVELSQEQAMVAALIESRSDDATLAGESLRSLVDTVVREAVRSEAGQLGAAVTATVEGLRGDLEAAQRSQNEHVAGLEASLAAAAADGEELRASLKAVVAESEELQGFIRAVAADSAAAVAASTIELPAELSRHDAGIRKAFRATLREELQPLVDVVADSVAQSDYEVKALARRLDRVLESQASLAAALAEMIEPAGLPPAGDDDDDDDPDAEPDAAVARPGRLESWAEQTGTGNGTPPVRGTRVSLRNLRPQA